jgi:hypothetical protein
VDVEMQRTVSDMENLRYRAGVSRGLALKAEEAAARSWWPARERIEGPAAIAPPGASSDG